MNRIRNILAPLALAASMLLASSAWAGEAQDYVRAKHTELTNVLKQPANAARQQKLTTLIDGMIDINALAEQSLGDNAKDRTPAELEEFKKVLQKLVKNNYEKNIQKTLNYEINYVGEDPAQDGFIVKTTAKSKKEGKDETVSIDYQLHKVDGKWMIFDIVTENSSMVRNYRNQFNKIIKRDGWNGLMTKLKKKAAEGSS